MTENTEPVLSSAEIRANIRQASLAAWGDVPEVARRERFRVILADHGRVSVDDMKQVLDELMDAV